MELMNLQDFKNLKHGDKIHVIEYGNVNHFFFVGKMPESENYWIFSNGENLIHVHKSKIENNNNFYKGEYNEQFVGNLLVNFYMKKIEILKEVYNLNISLNE